MICGEEPLSKDYLKYRFCLSGIAYTQLKIGVKIFKVCAGLGIHKSQLHLLQSVGA